MKDDTRTDYRHVLELQTRWMDNDAYSHVNNVAYYSYFDTAVNHLLITSGALDIQNSKCVAVVAQSSCSYYQSVAFPDVLHVGLRVAKLGRSSVRYEIGIFRKGEEAICASGYFVHVYVDRASGNSVPIPAEPRELLSRYLIEQ